MVSVDRDSGSGARDGGVAEGIGEVGGKPVDEAVSVGRSRYGEVVVQADDSPVRPDTDEQGAAVGVEEAGDGLDDGIFYRLVGLVFTEIPSGEWT